MRQGTVCAAGCELGELFADVDCAGTPAPVGDEVYSFDGCCCASGEIAGGARCCCGGCCCCGCGPPYLKGLSVARCGGVPVSARGLSVWRV